MEGSKVFPYLVLSEEFIVNGVAYYPTFDASTAASHSLKPRPMTELLRAWTAPRTKSGLGRHNG